MTKYERLKGELAESGSTLTFSVGDVVFCKVKGRIIDAHKITKIDRNKGYMIANNHGWENGWTKTVYGKVVKIEDP